MTAPDKATAARLAAKRLIELHAMGEDCYDEFKDYMRRYSIALVEALLAARPDEAASGHWRPTHRHAKGDLYMKLAEGKWEPDWSDATFYRNKGGLWIARPSARFNQRFEELTVEGKP